MRNFLKMVVGVSAFCLALIFFLAPKALGQAAYGTIYMGVTARTRWKPRVGPSSVELTLAYT